MTDDQFWNILAQARGASPASADSTRLKSILNTLADDEVSDFVRQLQLLYDGIQGRARSVYRLLRSP